MAKSPPPLTVHVHPNGFQNPPLTIEVVAEVPRNPVNRRLIIEVFSEDYSSTSERDLEGDSSSPLQRFRFTGLREGFYVIVGTLIQWSVSGWKLIEERCKDHLEIR